MSKPAAEVVNQYTDFAALQKSDPTKSKAIISVYKQICDYDDMLIEKLGLHTTPADEVGLVQFLTAKLSRFNGVIYTVEVEGIVVGIAAVMDAMDMKDSVYLSLLGIDKKYRGKGYGRALLEYVVETYKAQKKSLIVRVVSNNAAAVSLYNSCGFKIEWSKVLVCKNK